MTPEQQVLLDAADLLERDGWCRLTYRLPSGERCVEGALMDVQASQLARELRYRATQDRLRQRLPYGLERRSRSDQRERDRHTKEGSSMSRFSDEWDEKASSKPQRPDLMQMLQQSMAAANGRAGWTTYGGSTRKFHYTDDADGAGRSLCGKWRRNTRKASLLVAPETGPRPDDCVACRRKLDARKAAA